MRVFGPAVRYSFMSGQAPEVTTRGQGKPQWENKAVGYSPMSEQAPEVTTRGHGRSQGCWVRSYVRASSRSYNETRHMFSVR